MSNNRSNKKGGDEDDNICRDFLRNVCRRGASCKYNHPDKSNNQNTSQSQQYLFCHDFQNGECKRSTCKFIHCSKPEQDYFKETGKLPPALEDLVVKGLAGTGGEGLEGDIPVCRDYLKGDCSRGSRCKFRHLSRGDMEYEERGRRTQPQRDRYEPPRERLRDPYPEYGYDRMRRRSLYDDYDPYPDRAPSRARQPLDVRELEDENVMLRRKLEDFRKQISDLTATNEVLLEQNARFRVAKNDHTNQVLRAETHLVRSSSSGLPLFSHGNLLTQQAPGTPASTIITQENPATLTSDQILGTAVTLAQGIPTVSIPSVQTSMISYPIVSTNIRPNLGGR